MKHILVVDDDRTVCRSIQKLLGTEGYKVLSAFDAAAAIQNFSDNPIDLVVLDINLGPDNGWAVFETMVETNPFVPIMVITAEWGQHERAVALGAEALVEKPIDVPSFLDLIKSLLHESAEGRLRRACGDERYCRYWAKHYDTMLRALQERRAAPLKLSPGVKSALSAEPRVFASKKRTVIGEAIDTPA